MDREKGCSAMVGGNSSLWFRNALLPHGWASGVRLTLRDGLIAAVETKVEKAVGEESYAAAVPGIPNLHSHAFQRAMAGLTERRGRDDDDFWSWREAMYRFVDRIGPEDLESIAAQAFVEMLESGFTRVGEFHYLHHDPTGAPYGEPAQMAAALVSAA
jgi:formimidoylglutamate deiminase